MPKNSPIIIEETINAQPEEIWIAITQAHKMRQWFFENIENFKPEAGFETKFDVKAGDTTFLHLWKVVELEPEKKISLNWKYGGYTGDSVVTFELIPESDDQTKVKLTHTGIETFPQDIIPEFSRNSCSEGWNYFIRNSLKAFLEK